MKHIFAPLIALLAVATVASGPAVAADPQKLVEDSAALAKSLLADPEWADYHALFTAAKAVILPAATALSARYSATTSRGSMGAWWIPQDEQGDEEAHEPKSRHKLGRSGRASVCRVTTPRLSGQFGRVSMSRLPHEQRIRAPTSGTV